MVVVPRRRSTRQTEDGWAKGDQPELPRDADLVYRLRGKDEAAFALMLDAWSGGMRRVARSIVSTDASADEVVQDAWLAVIQGIGRFEARSSLKTWVYRILVNTAVVGAISDHLAGCDGCTTYVEQMRRTITTLGSPPPDVALTDEARNALLAAFRDRPS